MLCFMQIPVYRLGVSLVPRAGLSAVSFAPGRFGPALRKRMPLLSLTR